jgi:cytochrome c oxidase subunit 4
MSGHSPEEIKKHVKVYIGVFAALLFLTCVTVGVSYIHLPVHQAIIVALAVAITKASLVALFFMHLSNEKRVIYGTLALTAIAFVFLMSITMYL